MINILDANALDALTAVEGKRWREYQGTHRDSPTGFYRFLAAAQWRKANPDMSNLSISDIVTGGLDGLPPSHCGVIYGSDGLSRYFVRHSGVIVLLSSHANTEAIQRAKAAGIQVG